MPHTNPRSAGNGRRRSRSTSTMSSISSAHSDSHSLTTALRDVAAEQLRSEGHAVIIRPSLSDGLEVRSRSRRFAHLAVRIYRIMSRVDLEHIRA